MNKDILFQMVANKRGGVDPSAAIQAAIIETAQFAPGTDCRLELDKASNSYKLFRCWQVVEDTEESPIAINQIPLSKARQQNSELNIGDTISEEIHFSRAQLSKFRKAFTRELTKAERSNQTSSFEERIGSVLLGTVQRQQFSREGTILELEEEVELLLPHDQMIPREEIRVNDRLYVYLYKTDAEAKGPQLLVSRTHTGLLKGLFHLKILEVSSGVIEVKSVARDPGSRAKVAVKTNDGRLNPIGTCIGRSGERVQAISSELNDEHIDIILWDDNPAQLAIHALAPAEVLSITMDEDTGVMDIVVRTEDLPRAIGRNGQNVRLASQLIGWTLSIMSAEEVERKNIETFAQTETTFVEQLSIDPEQAAQLTKSGFSSIEEIACAANETLMHALNSTEESAEDLRNRANDLLLASAFATESESFRVIEDDGDTLDTLKGMTPQLLSILYSHNISSRDDLAELSTDDLLEIASIDRKEAGELIMNARAHWFKPSE